MKNSPETLFFDDFTAAHLNRDVWNVEVTGKIYNNEQQAYIDSPETVYISHSEEDCNGALVLQAHYRPGFTTPQGTPFDFVSGRVHTRGKFTFRYGRVSARLKTPAVSGV